MENDSFGHEYYYDGDGGVEMECKRQQSEVEMHINNKKEAYDRYMDMLLNKAYEAVSEQDDSETETTEDRA